ncbi:MAG: hypothetical protein ACU83N_06850 [Gammaproteobacteria bacterium]
MVVFLRYIPADTNKYDIEAFIEPALKGIPFARKGYICDIKIIALRSRQSTLAEYYGLVRIEPESAAKRVIKLLNMKKMCGQEIAVKEYRLRNWHHDRRIKGHSDITISNRRKVDRRRRNMQMSILLHTGPSEQHMLHFNKKAFSLQKEGKT